MTLEQLDEIERMAEAGRTLHAGTIALKLVKALREARAALDQVSSDDRMSEAQITAAITEAAKERDDALKSLRVARSDVACLWEERDEARAEVEQLKAERDEAWDRVDNLEGAIRDNIPYSYDQGEPDEDEANPEECVEYAAKEIADLKKENKRLREVMRQVHALVSTVRATAVLDDIEKLREIHKITKGTSDV